MLGKPEIWRLREAQRMDAFRLLVIGQDYGMSTDESRSMVRNRFHLTNDEVRSIEEEGIANDWPPLCDRQ
jgi:hypothetical protein